MLLVATVPITYGWSTPASAAPRGLTLAALGDSYSSGEGNPPFDTALPGCHRSNEAWPHLLGGMTPTTTLTLLAACSGATSSALTESFKDEPAQVSQLRELSPAPDVVTITIGGNDAGFGNVIISCYTWKCFWTGSDRWERSYITTALPAILKADYAAIQAAAPHSRIVVVGYPDIFPSSQRNNTCTWLGNKERGQVTSLNVELNQVIRKAASEAGVEFASTAAALRGHELCTRDSWVAPVNLTSPRRDLSGHPTAQGQQAMASAVEKYLYSDAG